MKSSKERVKGTDYLNSKRLILQLLVLSFARPVKARSQKQNHHLRDDDLDNIFS